MNTNPPRHQTPLQEMLTPFRICIIPGIERSSLWLGFKLGAHRWLCNIALTPLAILYWFSICMIGVTVGTICLFNSCLTALPEPTHSTCLHYIAYCVALSYCLGLVFMGLAAICFKYDQIERQGKYLGLSILLVLTPNIAHFFQPLSNDLAHRTSLLHASAVTQTLAPKETFTILQSRMELQGLLVHPNPTTQK